ncbi:hypothetical protein, partial [Novosphingobium sp. TCA1]|uniref:hypothetical protein n=1 Tax=Novosphingobium sp. TCA1 TaxID=2682474 RepID=UPI001F2CC442
KSSLESEPGPLGNPFCQHGLEPGSPFGNSRTDSSGGYLEFLLKSAIPVTPTWQTVARNDKVGFTLKKIPPDALADPKLS